MEDTKFERRYPNGNGTSDVWKYDYSITKNGPVSVEVNVSDNSFKKRIVDDEPKIEEETSNDSLPKTKRMYLNPANGKMVGYARAKFLNLIT